jgi:uncharacterized membrane protein
MAILGVTASNKASAPLIWRGKTDMKNKNVILAVFTVGMLNLILGMGDEMGWFLVPGILLILTSLIGWIRLRKTK